jgi:hypothetical protein
MDRPSELAAIAAFLEARGARRCPPRFAGSVALALNPAEEQARLAGLQPPQPLSRQQRARLHSAICYTSPGRMGAAKMPPQ